MSSPPGIYILPATGTGTGTVVRCRAGPKGQQRVVFHSVTTGTYR